MVIFKFMREEILLQAHGIRTQKVTEFHFDEISRERKMTYKSHHQIFKEINRNDTAEEGFFWWFCGCYRVLKNRLDDYQFQYVLDIYMAASFHTNQFN